MSQHVDVIVTAKDAYMDRLSDLTHRLRNEGLQVGRVLEFTGQVYGRCSSAGIESLNKVEGVAAVERSGEVTLPPPDAGVQ